MQKWSKDRFSNRVNLYKLIEVVIFIYLTLLKTLQYQQWKYQNAQNTKFKISFAFHFFQRNSSVKFFFEPKGYFRTFFEGILVLKNVKRNCLIPILTHNFRKKIFEKMSESNLLARKKIFSVWS